MCEAPCQQSVRDRAPSQTSHGTQELIVGRACGANAVSLACRIRHDVSDCPFLQPNVAKWSPQQKMHWAPSRRPRISKRASAPESSFRTHMRVTSTVDSVLGLPVVVLPYKSLFLPELCELCVPTLGANLDCSKHHLSASNYGPENECGRSSPMLR